MARKGETLEEGLDREANKKGLTGKERHRYIGGAIHNIKKRKGTLPAPKPKAVKSPARGTKSHTARVAPKPKPPKEKLVLVVKKNAAASKNRAYDVYSHYKPDGTQYGTATFRKRAAAVRDAADEMDAHNQGFKRKRLA